MKKNVHFIIGTFICVFVLFGAQAQTSVLNSTTSTNTAFTFAANAGSNRLVVVAVGAELTAVNDVSGITYGTNPMTKINDVIVGGGTREYSALFYIVEADIDSRANDNVAVTWTGGTGTVFSDAYAILTIENVDQADPIGATDVNSSASIATITASGAVTANEHDMIVSTADHGASTATYTSGGGLTELFDFGGSSQQTTVGIQVKTSTGSTTPQFTATSTNRMTMATAVINFMCSPGGTSGDLGAWYKADGNVNVAGTLVTSWDSEVSGGVSANTIVSDPDLTVGIANFNPAVVLDGNDYLYQSGITGNTFVDANDNTMFMVFNNHAGVVLGKWEETGGGALTREGMEMSGTAIRYDFPDAATQTIGTSNIRDNWVVATGNSSLTADTVYINSLREGQTTGGTAVPGGTGDFVIGANSDGMFPSTADIAELIFFREHLTIAQREQVESYLAIKYGVSLGSTASTIDYTNSSGTVIWNGSATYQNDIAGIGFDVNSCLNQKQSESQNSDQIITMGLGTIAATNAANGNTFSADRSYMIWGNDNDDDGTIEETTTDKPEKVLARLDREWLIEESGTVGDVELNIDITGIAVTATIREEFSLMVDEDGDGDFTTGTIRYYGADDFTANVLTFDAVDFADGEVFTLATYICAPGGVTTGLNLWLRADKGTDCSTDGCAVTTWSDQSAESNNATRSGGTGVLELSEINYNSVINAEDLDQDFSTPSLTGRTIFYAGQANTSGSFVCCNGYLGFDGDQGIRQNGDNTDTYRSNGAGSDGNDWSNGSTFYYNGIGDNANNISDIDDFHVASVERTSAHTNTFYVGGYDPGRYLDQSTFYGDVVVYSGTLSATERDRVSTYLAIKYGQTLGSTASTVNYLNTSGTTVWTGSATYQNDIAGIGRDDSTCLDQRQSTSLSTDAIISMGLGTIAASNAVHGTAFSGDQSYMIWGNDNDDDGTIEASTAEMPSGVMERLDREWIIRETGTVGDVEVNFDVSGLTISGEQAGDFLLLIDEDGNGDFTNGNIRRVLANDLTANVLTFDAVDFADGEVFTLATAVCAPGGVTTALNLWLKADDGAYTDAGVTLATNGQDVTEWHDAASSFDADQTTASRRPIWTEVGMNFNPVLTFDESNIENFELDDYASQIIVKDNTLFTAAQANSANQDIVLFATDGSQDGNGNGGSSDFEFQFEFAADDRGTIRGQDGLNATSFSYFTDAIAENLPRIMTVDYLAGGNVTRGLNALSPNVNAAPTSVEAVSRLVIGGHTNPGSQNNRFFDGIIGEVISYGDVLSAAEQLRVQSYLAVKYGITLGSTGDVINYQNSSDATVWTGSATYQNDIGGIARDDSSCLNQKQSKSVSTDAIVTMGLTTIAASNAANGNSFAVDQSYMLWGNDDDDNGTIEAIATDLPSGALERLDREWLIAESGTVGSVEVNIDIAGLTLTGTTQNDFALIIDEDGDGDFTTGTIRTIGADDLTGTVITFDAVDFANNEIFTLSTFQCSPGGVSANLKAWYMANGDISATGTTVDNWNNQVFGGVDLTSVSSDPDLTTNNINFNPAVVFDGNDRVFESAVTGDNFMDDEDNTMFTVTNFSGGAVIAKWQEVANNSRIGMEASGTAMRFDFPTAAGANQAIGASNISNQWTINTGHTNSVTTTIRINNLSDGTATGGSAAATYTNSGEYSVGSDGSFPFTGSVGEIIHYDDELSAANRVQVETYLAMKYGVTLGTTGSTVTYLNSSGTTVWTGSATYQNDVAGIARDDSSCLNQKQSVSVNSDAIVTMGLTTIAATNAANGNSFAADQSYMIWGNDNDDDGTVEASTADLPDGVLERLDREWVISETGTVGDVEVNVDLSGITVTGTDASHFSLIIDEDGDGDFSTGTIRKVVANDLTANVLTFDAVDLANGELFSLATYICGPGGVSTNLELWLRADNAVLNGGAAAADGANVEEWEDQSPQGRDAVDDDPTKGFPVYAALAQNFNPAVTFDGGDALLAPAAGIPDGGDERSVFVVATSTNNAGWRYAFGAGDFDAARSGTGFDFGKQDATNSGIVTTHNNPDQHIISPGFWDNNIAAIGQASVNASSELEISGNGETPTNLAGAVNTSAGSNIVIGANSQGTSGTAYNEHWQGDIAEVVFFDNYITGVPRSQVLTYLATKYGITLGTTVATFDYINSSGTTVWTGSATYQNDIGGIARDDSSCLNQKQSISQNDDAIVTMGLTSIAASNAANANTFASDQSYMIWGNDDDDDGTIEEIASELPPNTAYRLDREWFVSESGTVGNVQVTVDLTGISVTGSEASDFLIVIDDDGNFAAGTQSSVTATSFAGDLLTFDNVDFTDGDFFTIVSSSVCPGGVCDGLQLWLKADGDMTLVGSNVSVWEDHSGANHDVSNAVDATRPELIDVEMNFNPGIQFSGTDIALIDTDGENYINGMSGFSTFFATEATSVNNDNGFYNTQSTDVNDDNLGFRYDEVGASGGSLETWKFGIDVSVEGVVQYEGQDNLQSLEPQLWSQHWTSAAAPTVLLNGLNETFSFSDGVATGTLQNADDVAIGSGTRNTSGWGGNMGEAIIYEDELSATNKTKVQSYLAIKYGVTLGTTASTISYLASDGGTIWTGSGTYQNDLAGIGRDDASALDQKQSMSENDDAIVTIGNTAISASNSANVNNFTADDSYLIWGNNDGALDAAGVSDTGTTTNSQEIKRRLARVWLAEETGTVGTVKVRFDLSQIPGLTAVGANEQTDLFMLVDVDGTFATGALAVSPSSTNNATDIIEFDHDFDGGTGFFFTIGSVDSINAALPVEYLTFEVEKVGCNAQLNWTTINEVNNDFFEIERSLNGVNWSVIDKVEGAGNSSVALNYSYLDSTCDFRAQTIFYRLRQVDNDGAFDYSEVRSVTNSISDIYGFEVYPNPASTELTVRIDGLLGDENITYQILSIEGVSLKDGDLSKDYNYLDLTGLPAATYILEITSENQQTAHFSFVKIR